MTELKLKYNGTNKGIEAREDRTESIVSKSNGTEFYESHGNARNICFVLADGRHIFLNYSYLISGEYLPDTNLIVLTFTTHIVNIKGFRLDRLFEDLMEYLPKHIEAIEERYLTTVEQNKIIVQEIQIKCTQN